MMDEIDVAATLERANARIVELEDELRDQHEHLTWDFHNADYTAKALQKELYKVYDQLAEAGRARDEQTRMTAAASQEIARLKNERDALRMGLEAAGKIMQETADRLQTEVTDELSLDHAIAKLRSAAGFLGVGE